MKKNCNYKFLFYQLFSDAVRVREFLDDVPEDKKCVQTKAAFLWLTICLEALEEYWEITGLTPLGTYLRFRWDVRSGKRREEARGELRAVRAVAERHGIKIKDLREAEKKET